jgi:hypothetical protein
MQIAVLVLLLDARDDVRALHLHAELVLLLHHLLWRRVTIAEDLESGFELSQNSMRVISRKLARAKSQKTDIGQRVRICETSELDRQIAPFASLDGVVRSEKVEPCVGGRNRLSS